MDKNPKALHAFLLGEKQGEGWAEMLQRNPLWAVLSVVLSSFWFI